MKFINSLSKINSLKAKYDDKQNVSLTIEL